MDKKVGIFRCRFCFKKENICLYTVCIEDTCQQVQDSVQVCGLKKLFADSLPVYFPNLVNLDNDVSEVSLFFNFPFTSGLKQFLILA